MSLLLIVGGCISLMLYLAGVIWMCAHDSKQMRRCKHIGEPPSWQNKH